MKNERPSRIKNLGEDISGAARHFHDTYDNPEREKRKREAAQKKSKDALKKQAAIDIKTSDNPMSVIMSYEIKSFCQKYDIETKDTVKDLKLVIESLRSSRQDFYTIAKDFNRMSRRVRKADYYGLEFQRSYFDKKTKNTFHEKNGLERSWSSELNSFDVSLLDGQIRALQFGNSVTDNERIYCASSLKASIDIIKTHFDLDLSKIAFAFGSRGKAGSIAHYEPSLNTLAFNRGWIGAFAHELGHAIDEKLNRPSFAMPFDLKKDYLQQIKDNPNRKYYAKNSEIFARMFEMYCIEILGIKDEFFCSIFDMSVMPKMTPEIKTWLETVMASILKRGN